jgi:hypothetical protein
MSERITGELRGVVTDGVGLSAFNGNVLEETLSVLRMDFESRCDSIDSIHANLERENDRLKCELDRVLGELDGMHKTDGISDNSSGFMQNAEHHAWAPESHYVMLPKDADGVPIHIGDVMDSKVDYLFDGKPFTVRGLVLCEDGWEVTDGRFGNRYKPDSLRHHHEPTVEDVLREFAYGLGVPVADSYVAAAAAKLQLRGDAQ